MTKATESVSICPKCGTECKGTALYCFNCGSPLASSPVPESPADSLSQESSSQPEDGPVAQPEESAEAESGDDLLSAGSANDEARADDGPADDPGPGMTAPKSAAELRRDPLVKRMKRIEVRWEEADSAPNLWFFVAAFFLALTVFAVFLLSMYLR